MDGNEIKSIRVLRDIFNLSYDSAEKATKHFLAKYEENPGVFMHVMEIRFKVQNGKNHEALKALYELFGLQSIDGILALEAMREIIKNAEESDNPWITFEVVFESRKKN